MQGKFVCSTGKDGKRYFALKASSAERRGAGDRLRLPGARYRSALETAISCARGTRNAYEGVRDPAEQKAYRRSNTCSGATSA